MQVKRTFSYLFAFIAIAMFIIWFFILMLLNNREKLQESQIKNLKLSSLADDLRLTYHNFSKYSRNYVFTGDTIWARRYFDLLNTYKKNISQENENYIGAWQEKLKTLGLVKKEMDLLDLSNDLAFLFISNEIDAIKKFNHTITAEDEKLTRSEKYSKEKAKELLFSKDYRTQKHEALLIIDEIEESIGQRTESAVKLYSRNGKYILLFLIIFISLVIVFSIIAFRLINRQLKLQELDINERQLAEKALAQKEQQLQYAFNVSNEGIWDYSINNNTFYFNQRGYDLFGISYDKKMQATDWLKLLNDKEQTDNDSSLIQIINKNKVYDKITKVKNIKGQNIWIHIIGKAVEYDSSNTPQRIVGTITDITDRMQQEEQIVNAVLETEDRERNRIAGDIHDGLQQTMTTALLSMEKVRSNAQFNNNDLDEKFNLGYSYLKKAISESRALAHNLMPKIVDNEGLIVAVDSLIDALKGSSNTEFHFHHNINNIRLKLAVEITLYRIIQESINNITKYAKAKKADIQLLKHPDVISLTIADDGIGFDLSKTTHTFGLNSMKTRAESIGAFFEIESRIGRGTHILVELPN